MKRLAAIGLILFTSLIQNVIPVQAAEVPWREVYYGQSISGNPYIGETLVFDPGSWPVKAGVTHEWRTDCCAPLNDSGVLSTAFTFTPSEKLAGSASLAVWSVDRSNPGIVYYSRTRVGPITCRQIAPPTIQVTHNPSQPTASLSISGGTNPTVSKSVGLPRPEFLIDRYVTRWDPTGEDQSSWPNKTYEYFVGKNGQILTWSVYSKKIVSGTYFSVDCSSSSVYTFVEFGVVYKEAPRLTESGTGTLRLANDNPVWGNQSVQTYQWLVDGVPIPGATSSSYNLRAADQGAVIKLDVTGSKSGWPSRTTSSLGYKITQGISGATPAPVQPGPAPVQPTPAPAPSVSAPAQPVTATSEQETDGLLETMGVTASFSPSDWFLPSGCSKFSWSYLNGSPVKLLQVDLQIRTSYGDLVANNFALDIDPGESGQGDIQVCNTKLAEGRGPYKAVLVVKPWRGSDFPSATELLTFKARPTTLNGVVATASTTFINLTWIELPAARLLGYEVRIAPGATKKYSSWKSTDYVRYKFSNLKRKTAYLIQVRALTPDGYGTIKTVNSKTR
jgi:hypothetical protein